NEREEQPRKHQDFGGDECPHAQAPRVGERSSLFVMRDDFATQRGQNDAQSLKHVRAPSDTGTRRRCNREGDAGTSASRGSCAEAAGSPSSTRTLASPMDWAPTAYPTSAR